MAKRRWMANGNGVINLRRALDKNRVLDLCGELITRMKDGKPTTLDFRNIEVDDTRLIITAMAPMYICFEHEDIRRLLKRPTNISDVVALVIGSEIARIKEQIELTEGLDVAHANLISPIIDIANREMKPEFIMWLTNYLPFPVAYYKVEFWNLEDQTIEKGHYANGVRQPESVQEI